MVNVGGPFTDLKTELRDNVPGSTVPRRRELFGAAIVNSETHGGLEIEGDAVLPFLLAARATAISARQAERALFAEGLSSSYEAYRQTRKRPDSDELLDEDDDETTSQAVRTGDLSWYLSNLDMVLPVDNESTHVGQGFVSYTVRPKATSATGAVVSKGHARPAARGKWPNCRGSGGGRRRRSGRDACPVAGQPLTSYGASPGGEPGGRRIVLMCRLVLGTLQLIRVLDGLAYLSE